MRSMGLQRVLHTYTHTHTHITSFIYSLIRFFWPFCEVVPVFYESRC